jgi:hypothetical protein
VIVPVNGEPIHLGSLTLTPFAGLHLTDGHGVPSQVIWQNSAENAGSSRVIPACTTWRSCPASADWMAYLNWSESPQITGMNGTWT